MDTSKERDIKEAKTSAATFTKEQILASSKWADKKDALTVILADDKKYTADYVTATLKNFMKGKVK